MKILRKIIAAACVAAALFTPIRAAALDPWVAAVGSLGAWASYESTLTSILRLGNNVNAQVAARRQDVTKNGTDKNPSDVRLVDSVMSRLVDRAAYALRANSLPFTWHVNDDETFNAACYPMNYVSVNRGLLEVLNSDEDQLAAILAHEMFHGIEQHSAKNYAQAAAQSVGAMMIGASLETGNIDWSRMAGMVRYSIAKTVTTPIEYAADAGGFYLMTSAGFNPGGGAAAMARMDYYLRYETRNFLEFDAHDKASEQTFSDHPDTENREKKLAELMTDYSCGHVTVKKADRQYKVYVDGAEIYTASNTGGQNNAASKAYIFAGGLARAFHDYDTAAAWNFRTGAGNTVDFLDDDRVFKQARDIAFAENLGSKIRTAVEAAYMNEKNRKKYLDAEAKRLAAWEKIRAEARAVDAKAARQLMVNADTYNDYGQGELALVEIARAMDAENQPEPAECLAIRGRAKAILKDFEGALADTNAAVAQNPANIYTFLNRADVRHRRGEIDFALADIDAAIKIDATNPIPYQLRAEIFDERGDTDAAEEDYRACYDLSKKNPRAIPLKYLEKIDAKAAEKIRKASETASAESSKSDSGDAE